MLNNKSIQWQPIVTMAGHPHGIYICLIKSNCQEGYYLQERYFTYNEDHQASFETAEEAEGVVAFLIPRTHLEYRDDALHKILRKIAGFKKEMKGNKALRRVENFIRMKWRLK